MKNAALLAMMVGAITGGTVALLRAQNTPLRYRQPDAPVDARVADLLARMTLEEKVAQLQGIWNRKRERNSVSPFLRVKTVSSEQLRDL